MKKDRGKCPFAHNPIELEIIEVSIKKNNLMKTIKTSTKKMRESKAP